MNRLHILVLLFVCCAVAFPARGANITWSGATNSNWTVGSNWVGGIMPGGVDTAFVNNLTGPVVSGVSPGTISVLYVGYSATGVLTVENGGIIQTTGHSFLGNATVPLAPLYGEVTVTGTGSALNSGGDLRIGNNTNGTLNIRNGARAASTGGAYLGYIAGLGTVIVSGAGSELVGGTGIIVGNSGHGALTVEDGGRAFSTGALTVANVPASNSTVAVSGTGSSLAVASIILGNVGTGALNVTGGASASATGAIHVSLSGTGTATVSGAGSSLSSSGGELRIGGGNGSNGTLNILNGATAQSGNTAHIGYNVGSTGRVTVDGTGSALSTNTELRIGSGGNGTLAIQNAGRVTSASHTYIGNGASSTGAATVTGAGSTLQSNAQLLIGNVGNGTLTVQDGGHASATANLFVGNAPNSSGTLNILNGGTVQSGLGNIGQQTLSTGVVKINGAGSSWIAGDARIGQWGTATVTIENSGSMTTSQVQLGTLTGSVCTLNVLSGGTFTNTGSSNISFGNGAGATGSGIISGSNSLFQTNGQLSIGNSGAGTLTASNGGTVKSGGTLYIGRLGGSTGTVNIGAAAGDPAAAAGIIDTSSINFGTGTGKIVFNHTNSDYTLASDISGGGTMDFLSGVTTLTGNNGLFTGTVNARGGTLRINGIMNASADVTVDDGALFGGNATVGDLLVQNGGTLSPGNSIGTTNVVTATFNPGSVYEVEVNAAGQSDLLNASGAVTINGGTVRAIPFPDYAANTPYTIISAAGGVLGTGFDTLQTSAFMTGQLSYNANNVLLTLVPNAAALLAEARTRNQSAVVAGADGVTGNAAIDALVFSADGDAARIAMDALSGEIHASMSAAQMKEQQQLRDIVLRRRPDTSRELGDGVVWASASGARGQVDSDDNAASADENAHGVLVGIETTPSPQSHIGIAIGESVSKVAVSDRSSTAKSRNHHVIGYGGTQIGGIDLEGGASWTWHDIETERDVIFDGFDGDSEADYRAQTGQLFLSVGKPLRFSQTIVLPYVQAAYIHHTSEAFDESGDAGLDGHESRNSVATTAIGADVSHEMRLDAQTSARLDAGAGWQHVLTDTDVRHDLAFDGGSEFAIYGAPISRDALLLRAGMQLTFDEAVSVSTDYSGALSSGTQAHSITGRVAVRF